MANVVYLDIYEIRLYLKYCMYHESFSNYSSCLSRHAVMSQQTCFKTAIFLFSMLGTKKHVKPFALNTSLNIKKAFDVQNAALGNVSVAFSRSNT